MCHAHARSEDTGKQTNPMNDPQADADWEDARQAWREEHEKLIHLWNCTEPMTPEQLARLAELDSSVRLGGGGGVLAGDDKGESNEGPRSTTRKAHPMTTAPTMPDFTQDADAVVIAGAAHGSVANVVPAETLTDSGGPALAERAVPAEGRCRNCARLSLMTGFLSVCSDCKRRGHRPGVRKDSDAK